MKRNVMIAALTATFLALQGCVVVIGHGTEDGVYWGGEKNDEGGVQHDGDRLSRDVARAFAADAELVAQEIRISSEDGLVVLKGRVDSIGMLERAVAIAKGVEGVDKVVSRVTVSTS